jgi:hypothetical protein
VRRIRDAALVAAAAVAIDRLLRSRREPASGHGQPAADEPIPRPSTPSGRKAWLIHPDIEAVMRELGVEGFVLPEADEAPILRARMPGGGYWRIEHVPRPGGRLDHVIQRRGALESPVESVKTSNGTMEVVLDLGDLPEVVAAALPGRRLGDVVGIAAPAGDAIVEDMHRRTMAATRPTVLRTVSQAYVIRDTRP